MNATVPLAAIEKWSWPRSRLCVVVRSSPKNRSQIVEEIVMANHRTRDLRCLEGREVCVALHGGRRLDGCELVSAGRCRAATVWLFADGQDVFVPVDDVLDVWEAKTGSRRAA
jgi:hypothetical protein